jgi:hypothetical protein
MAPIGTDGATVEAPVLLQAADKVPPVVTKPFQQSPGGIPRVEKDVGGATAQSVAGITEQLQGQGVLGGPAFVPEADTEWNTEDPVCPDEEDQGEAIDGFALLT